MGTASSVLNNNNDVVLGKKKTATAEPRTVTPPSSDERDMGGDASTTTMMVDLLGEELLIDSGATTASTAELCQGKVVGIYFSAHWCPPCRAFTPVLAESYRGMKQRGKAMEIVFVSSDQDDGSFQEYFGSMPWAAVPFANSAIKRALGEKFGVSGIPCLVFVDGDTGSLITLGGRAKVTNDPLGWGDVAPGDLATATATTTATADGGRGASKLLGDTVVGGSGTTVSTAELCSGKTVGIYFSAHWCPPCRGFTPTLANTYKMLKGEGRPIEMIFVSSDQDQTSFDQYFGEMPWHAVDFRDRQRKAALSEEFGVRGIPTLVFINGDTGALLTKDGRSKVMNRNWDGLF